MYSVRQVELQVRYTSILIRWYPNMYYDSFLPSPNNFRSPREDCSTLVMRSSMDWYKFTSTMVTGIFSVRRSLIESSTWIIMSKYKLKGFYNGTYRFYGK